MPRAASPTELALLEAIGYKVWVKVEIEDPNGDLQDFRSVSSMNWIDGVVLDFDIDQPVAQATVTLMRQIGLASGTNSLSPFRADSTLNRDADDAFAPAIDVGRRLCVSIAATALGATPGVDDWKPMHDGPIDKVDLPNAVMTITGRDQGAVLVDSFYIAEATFDYTNNPTPIEDVAQDLIDALFASLPDYAQPDPPIEIFCPTSPDYLIDNAFKVSPKDSGMDALQRLVQIIGWDLRYRWDDGTASFRLTLLDPGRDKTTPDLTVAANSVIRIQTLNVDRTNVRNHVTVRYGAPFGPEGNARLSEFWLDENSIRRYGLHMMVDEESSDSAIDTSAEALALAQIIVADLKDPRAEHAPELFYYWPIELHDLFRVGANDQHYDTDQDYAVVQIKHTITPNSARSLITTRGSPAGGYRQWIKRARGSTLPGPNDKPSQSLNNVKFTDSPDGTTRTFTWERGSDVQFVLVFDTLETAPPSDDPWPTDDDTPAVVLSTGTNAYAVAKPPAGFQRFIQLEPRLGNLQNGPIRRLIVDPAPPALSAKISATLANGLADLTVTVAAGVSDWSVTVDVYEDDPAGTPIATTSVSANTTLTKATLPDLGSRTAPTHRAWFVRLTNVAGVETWAATSSPANAPTVTVRVQKDTNGDLEDIYAIGSTANGETVRAFVRDVDDPAAPVYGLVTGASDSTPLFVASGAEIGPSSYFTDGLIAPNQKLNDIALTRDQTQRRYLRFVGQKTGLASTWIPVTLSLKDVPFLESLSVVWDAATNNLRVRVKGGAKCASVFIEVASNSTFTSPSTTSHALAPGDDYTATFALSTSDIGKTWYARATPYNAVSLGGLAGEAMVAEGPVRMSTPSGAISFDPIAGNTAGQASVSVTITGPLEAASWKYKIDSSAQPSVATVLASGTVLNSRAFAQTGLATVNLGDDFYITAVPFTGASGTGTQLPEVPLHAAYTSIGSSTTVLFSFGAFKPDASATAAYTTNSGALQSTAALGNQIGLTAAFQIPQGCTITRCAEQAYSNPARGAGHQATVALTLFTLDGAGGRTGALVLGASAVGWQSVVNSSLSISTTSNTFLLLLQMQNVDAATDGLFAWAEVTYTRPNQSKGL